MLEPRKAIEKLMFKIAIVLSLGAAAMVITYWAGYEPDFDVIEAPLKKTPIPRYYKALMHIIHVWSTNKKLDEKTWFCSKYSEGPLASRCENDTKVCFETTTGLKSCFVKLPDRLDEDHENTPMVCTKGYDGITCRNTEAYCNFDQSRNWAFCIPHLIRDEDK